MAKRSLIVGLVLLLSVIAEPLMADDSIKDSPWKKFSFSAGAFTSASDTDVRFGSGVGVTIDLEDALGLNTDNTVFRVETNWRFTDNGRHRLDLTWFSFSRKGDNTITDDVDISPPEGEDITIPSGTEVSSYFDLDIFQLNYSYSFIQDDRLDFAGLIGLYIMPMSFGLSATGFVDEEGDQSFTAPLPVIGFRFDVLIVPKWYFRTGSQIFYLRYQDFTGSLLNFRSAVEYNPWKHVGFGLGFDALRLGLQADDAGDYPGIDLRGNVDFSYNGLMLYGRVFF